MKTMNNNDENKYYSECPFCGGKKKVTGIANYPDEDIILWQCENCGSAFRDVAKKAVIVTTKLLKKSMKREADNE